MDVSRARAGRYARACVRWWRLLVGGRPRPGLRVSYGWDRIPSPDEPATGGTAKLQRLSARFTSHPADFSLLYLAAPHFPRDVRWLVRLARRRRVPVVVNQNGVAYPAWAGSRADELNRVPREVLRASDYVLYQSAFCKEAADRFLGHPPGGWEVLPNAVDVSRFTPAACAPEGAPVLLLGGDQTQPYRLELALRVLAELLNDYPDARLLVSGQLVVAPDPLAIDLGIANRLEVLGRYTLGQAPALLRRAHVLLHTKVQDPCPSVVIEAMACGVPVVYPASGGTVELVGEVGGIGVPHEASWDREVPPSPAALADAVGRVLDDHERYRTAARARAVDLFSIEPWLDRHEELFGELLASAAPGR